MKNDYKPQRKTLEKVINYLSENNIDLYGPCMDPDSGMQFNSHMNYDLEDVIARVKHIENDTLFEDEDGN